MNLQFSTDVMREDSKERKLFIRKNRREGVKDFVDEGLYDDLKHMNSFITANIVKELRTIRRKHPGIEKYFKCISASKNLENYNFVFRNERRDYYTYNTSIQSDYSLFISTYMVGENYCSRPGTRIRTHIEFDDAEGIAEKMGAQMLSKEDFKKMYVGLGYHTDNPMQMKAFEYANFANYRLGKSEIFFRNMLENIPIYTWLQKEGRKALPEIARVMDVEFIGDLDLEQKRKHIMKQYHKFTSLRDIGLRVCIKFPVKENITNV